MSAPRLFFKNQRHPNQMLANEPGLQLVGAENIADNQIVGSLISRFVRQIRDVETALNDHLVSLEETGDLNRHLFPATRRPLDSGYLGYAAAHRDRDAAK